LAPNSGGKTRLIAHSEKNHDFQHILGESMIQSKFWEKMISSTFWEQTMVGSTFWGINMYCSTKWEKKHE
jgi:hypothetical protein